MSTRVKICGIRRGDDAELAVELGACAIGFVFWPDSPRFIDPFRARPIAAALPPCVTAVGVFVDQPFEYVTGVAGLVRLGAIQLHGSESPDEYQRTGHHVIKAVSVSDGFAAESLAAIPASTTVLLDAHDPVKRGGTGRTIDWTEAARAARLRRIVLSGGLTADNVAEAVRTVRPFAVDVSSGVESAPGIKDAGRLRAFFEALNQS